MAALQKWGPAEVFTASEFCLPRESELESHCTQLIQAMSFHKVIGVETFCTLDWMLHACLALYEPILLRHSLFPSAVTEKILLAHIFVSTWIISSF